MMAGIAEAVTDMKSAQFQSEVSMRVLKMSNEAIEHESGELVKMMAAVTGIGHNIDILI